MELRDWLVIIGWPVTLVLSVFVTWLGVRLKRKKRAVSWALDLQKHLVSPELSQERTAKVELLVSGQTVKTLTLLSLRIACTGNSPVGATGPDERALEFKINLGAKAKIVDLDVQAHNSEADRITESAIESSGARIRREFMNPGDEFGVRILVAEYEEDAVEVHIAHPGTSLERMSPTEIANKLFSRTTALEFGLLGFGVKTDPSAVALNEINRSLQSIERRFRAHGDDRA